MAAGTKKFRLGDESVKSDFQDKPAKFDPKMNVDYIMRVVTVDPTAIYGTRVEWKNAPDKGFFAQTLADYDTADAAVNGDQAALKKAKQACPLFARGYGNDMKRRFVWGVYIVKEVDPKGRETPVNRFLPMTGGAELFETLTHTAKRLPPHPNKPGELLSLRQVELSVKCTDAKYKKLTITPITSASQMSKKWSEVWAEVKQYFAGDKPEIDECTLVQEFITPESFQKMNKSLDRAEGKDNSVDDDGMGDQVDGDGDGDTPPATNNKPPKTQTTQNKGNANAGNKAPAANNGKGNKQQSPPASAAEDDLDAVLADGDGLDLDE